MYVHESFVSKIFLRIGQFGQMGKINCGVFGVQKTKILRYFKGIYIWDWDMNLGCKELGI